MHDAQPTGPAGRYDLEIVLMQEMGWSWRELMETPADLVEELALRHSLEAKWRRERRNMEKALRKGAL